MTVFVFYDDGQWDDGDVGWEDCGTREEAAKFIQERMAKAKKPDLSDYLVIEGKPLKITAVQVATRIQFE